MVHCLLHNDRHPSLQLTQSRDGMLLAHCFGGCDQDRVIDALKAKGIRVGKSPGRRTKLKPMPAEGPTVERLASAKKIPVEFLRSLGVTDTRLGGTPVVKVPYFGIDNTVAATRFRLELSGNNRFRWRSGDKAMPYGLDRLAVARKAGWVLIVEGESDCWTLWYYGLPALGIPGKGTWRPEWARFLDGIQPYLWQEPDAAELPFGVGKDLPALRVIRAPDGIKDPSDAHLLGLDFLNWLDNLRTHATPFAALIEERRQTAAAEWRAKAQSVFQSDDPLVLVVSELRRMGYGDSIDPALITYLAASSRVLALNPGTTPVHLIVLGPASGGKSFTVNVVRRLFPPEAFHTIDAGSPRALIYDSGDLQHRVIFFGEADSIPSGEDNPAASAIRNLLQENVLRYSVVVRDESTGEFRTKDIERPGPSVLITTSVRRLGSQLMTRLFELEINDTPEHVRQVLHAQARLELDGSSEPDEALIAFQGYLQARAPWRVNVSFADVLADELGKSTLSPRIARDFSRLLSFIKTIAVLRHTQREHDAEGRITATLEDYDTARDLVNELFAATATELSRRTRDTVNAVDGLIQEREDDEHPEPVRVAHVAACLKISKPAARQRVNAALESGWLANANQGKRVFNLILGEPMPGPDEIGLPTAERLAELLQVKPSKLRGLQPSLLEDSEKTSVFTSDSDRSKQVNRQTESKVRGKAPTGELVCSIHPRSAWIERPGGGWVCGACHPIGGDKDGLSFLSDESTVRIPT